MTRSSTPLSTTANPMYLATSSYNSLNLKTTAVSYAKMYKELKLTTWLNPAIQDHVSHTGFRILKTIPTHPQHPIKFTVTKDLPIEI